MCWAYASGVALEPTYQVFHSSWILDAVRAKFPISIAAYVLNGTFFQKARLLPLPYMHSL